jgi:hypothetical protein
MGLGIRGWRKDSTKDLTLYIILKLIRLPMLYISVTIAENYMTQIYTENVLINDIDPPDLMNFLYVTMTVDFILNLIILLCLWAFRAPLQLHYKNHGYLFMLEYIILMCIMALLFYFIIQKMYMKKYFMYKDDGLRAIRALKQLVLEVGCIIYMIPILVVDAVEQNGAYNSVPADVYADWGNRMRYANPATHEGKIELSKLNLEAESSPELRKFMDDYYGKSSSGVSASNAGGVASDKKILQELDTNIALGKNSNNKNILQQAHNKLLYFAENGKINIADYEKYDARIKEVAIRNGIPLNKTYQGQQQGQQQGKKQQGQQQGKKKKNKGRN